jgi:hypothetical protein
MPLRSALALAVIFVALALAGCAGPPAPPPAPTPGPISTAPPAPLPRPVDGDNLAACAAGSCVVRVKASSVIPLNPQLNVLNIRVEAITPTQVNFAMDVGPGNFHSYGCPLSLTNGTATTPGLLKTQCYSGGKLICDKVSMGVVAIGQDVAIIRLIPL